jgi:hypothetical protein
VLKSAGVGVTVLRAVQGNQLHIFTHRTSWQEVLRRHELMVKSYAASFPDS